MNINTNTKIINDTTKITSLFFLNLCSFIQTPDSGSAASQSNEDRTNLGRGSSQTIGWSGSLARPKWANSCAHLLQERVEKTILSGLKCSDSISFISLKMTPPGAWSKSQVVMAWTRFFESVSGMILEIPSSVAARSSAKQASPSATKASCTAVRRPVLASTPWPSLSYQK